MEAKLEVLKTFHDKLNDEWVGDVRFVRDRMSQFKTSDSTFGDFPWMDGVSSAWNSALDSRKEEAETVESELEFYFEIIHGVAIDYEIVDDDTSDGIYQHA
ncbi:MAG: hypothetical protein ACRD6Q_05040 [Nitrososphaeraceae archaeon]